MWTAVKSFTWELLTSWDTAPHNQSPIFICSKWLVQKQNGFWCPLVLHSDKSWPVNSDINIWLHSGMACKYNRKYFIWGLKGVKNWEASYEVKALLVNVIQTGKLALKVTCKKTDSFQDFQVYICNQEAIQFLPSNTAIFCTASLHTWFSN